MPVVYGLVDPREPDRVRYVGCTVNPEARYGQHLAVTVKEQRLRLPLRRSWIAALRGHGVYPHMVLLESVADVARLYAMERKWIAHFREIGEADLNKRQGNLPAVRVGLQSRGTFEEYCELRRAQKAAQKAARTAA